MSMSPSRPLYLSILTVLLFNMGIAQANRTDSTRENHYKSYIYDLHEVEMIGRTVCLAYDYADTISGLKIPADTCGKISYYENNLKNVLSRSLLERKKLGIDFSTDQYILGEKIPEIAEKISVKFVHPELSDRYVTVDFEKTIKKFEQEEDMYGRGSGHTTKLYLSLDEDLFVEDGGGLYSYLPGIYQKTVASRSSNIFFADWKIGLQHTELAQLKERNCKVEYNGSVQPILASAVRIEKRAFSRDLYLRSYYSLENHTYSFSIGKQEAVIERLMGIPHTEAIMTLIDTVPAPHLDATTKSQIKNVPLYKLDIKLSIDGSNKKIAHITCQ